VLNLLISFASVFVGENARPNDLAMLPLPGVAAVCSIRRWRTSHILRATALLTVTVYGFLLFSRAPSQLEETVRALRALPNDFSQHSSSRHTNIDYRAISDTLAAVDGLRREFDRQQWQSQAGYTERLMGFFSATQTEFDTSGAPEYPSCGLSASDKKRYAELRQDGRVFIAINLLENERLMPTLTRELLSLLQQLGPDRVFVSIYENASMDLTVMHLRLLCKVSTCAET
jgi:hypothetical protein